MGAAAAESSGDDEGPSRQEMFETISNERRRMVVHSLQRDGATDLRTLSRQVAAWENDTEPSAVSAQQRRRVYNALQQSHLPKMDDNAVVDYDHDRGTVEPTDSLEELTVFLEIVPEKEISWGTYYTLLGSVCLALCSAVALGVYPFVLFGMAPTALACSLLLLGSGLVHRYRSERLSLGTGDLPSEV
ncbi:DUF7344 domain-containing protein [Halosegnis marinus]|uniref:DUF7344 domain-containing protein n=1 Tax=Halosegnis marinus TaxID=3034023 RepID=A0ABD5ZPX3_9EURY|nr:hypothetical protein [Halosegnis sp. DT85]